MHVLTTQAYRSKVRIRIAQRLAIVPPQTVASRIAEEAECRQAALLREARRLNLVAVPDPGHPGQYITRIRRQNRSTAHLDPTGRCNLTTVDTCTCPEFRVWHRCPCRALVIETVAQHRASAPAPLTLAELHHGTEAA